MCTDNRFELIEEFKKKLIESTNIETSPEEMKVIDNILFRFWQMGWLESIYRMPLVKESAKTLVRSVGDSASAKAFRNAGRFMQNAIDGEAPEFEKIPSVSPDLSEEDMRLIKKLRSFHNGSYAVVLDKLITAACNETKQQATVSSDCIYRQQAIDSTYAETVSTNPEHFKSSEKFMGFMDDIDISDFGRWQWANGFNTALVATKIQLEKLPSAEPRKKGKWIEHHEPYTWMGYAYWTCSKCNFGEKEENKERSNFCPHCGADMREGEQE